MDVCARRAPERDGRHCVGLKLEWGGVKKGGSGWCAVCACRKIETAVLSLLEVELSALHLRSTSAEPQGLAIFNRNVASNTPDRVAFSCSLVHTRPTMRLRLFGLALGLLGFVSALSAQGQNLLVVIEDESDKTKYSQFWSDLQGNATYAFTV